jgi:hypothetical protein
MVEAWTAGWERDAEDRGVLRRVAAVREVLPTYADVGRLFGELSGYAERHGVRVGDRISVW